MKEETIVFVLAATVWIGGFSILYWGVGLNGANAFALANIGTAVVFMVAAIVNLRRATKYLRQLRDGSERSG